MEAAGSAEDKTIRLRLDLAYDGSGFAGWATQPGLRTVQATVESALAVLLRTPEEAVRLTVAGRTDAGVHAQTQVCHVDVTDQKLVRLIGKSPGIAHAARKLNGVLKKQGAADVHVHEISVAPAGFDARFSALARWYEYRVLPLGARVDPRMRGFTVAINSDVDVARMNLVSQSVVGLNDFTSFCKARPGATAIRTLLLFEWARQPDGVVVARLGADAFCHSMVRSLVGGVVAVGEGRLSVEEFANLASARERSSRVRVMPAHGLTLQRVDYPPEAELAQRAKATRARRTQL